MCYAVSTGPDPLGPYYRYEFLRPLFPDYPRPAVWPDGYYVPTSTGDNPISETIATQKHACVVDRAKMLRGEPATEQCVIIDDVNFLNNADIDGKTLPPAGAPNIMMAAGGTQLREAVRDDRIYAWQFHVDWTNPSTTRVTGPRRRSRSRPYHYLCDGQLTNCVPQPGTESRLDAQGDKIMSRLVYRRIGTPSRSSPCTRSTRRPGGGGVRWYEFRVDSKPRRAPAPAGHLRARTASTAGWRARRSTGTATSASAIRSAARRTSPASASPAGWRATRSGVLTLRETVLVEGEGAQTTMRWEDYTTDGDRSERRLHDLVRRRLPQEGRRELFDAHRRVPAAGVRAVTRVSRLRRRGLRPVRPRRPTATRATS